MNRLRKIYESVYLRLYDTKIWLSEHWWCLRHPVKKLKDYKLIAEVYDDEIPTDPLWDNAQGE